MVNNDDNGCTMHGGAPDGTYKGVLSGRTINVCGGGFSAEIGGNSGEIWVPEHILNGADITKVVDNISIQESTIVEVEDKVEESVTEATVEPVVEKSIIEEIIEVAEKQDEVLVEAKVEIESPEKKELDLNKPYEEMTIEELQASILAKMAKNGPVTEDMKRTVTVNTHQGSLLNWVRSFN